VSSGSRPGRREAAGRHFCLGAYFQLSEGPKSRFSTDIESLYTGLDKRLAQRTLHFIHCTLGACIGAAVRSRKLARSPISDMAVMPSPGVGEHGKALEPDQPEALLRGFRGTVYFPIVAVAAFTGARRNEVRALSWSDLDVTAKTLRIERAIELTEARGLTIKPPKTKRGFREITIDDDLIALLMGTREAPADRRRDS